MISESLPPSSRDTGVRFFAQFSPISLPTAVLPVNVTASTSGFVVSQLPTLLPLPVTRFTAFGSTPAFTRSSAIFMLQNGVSDAGLITTALPISSAGTIL